MKHIHFVGIKGVGQAPLAIIAKEAGFTVTGCDVADGFITDEILQKSDIMPFVGFDEAHITDADLVITTGAHGGYDNKEIVAAKKKQIPVMTQGEAVGEFMKGDILGKKYIGISITGTHGKTTTTAMIASVLKSGGLDPSWVVGTSTIPSLGFSGHFGKGQYFVAEADEYANEPQYDKTPKLLLQKPTIAVITNIEHDHPDVYKSIDDVRNTFLQFAQNLPAEGLLVTHGDDPQIKKLLQDYKGNVATYGIDKGNDFVISDIIKTPDKTTWNISHQGQVENLELSIPGEHNVLNATAAYVVAKQVGLSVDTIRSGFSHFGGTKRRMEYIGMTKSGSLLYDDYAHHPTEIQKTLTALREKYPNKKLVCIFQPHTFSRTKLLFDQFIDSLSLADETIIAKIYPSAREPFDSTVSSQQLVDKLKTKKPSFYANTLGDVVKYSADAHFGNDTIIVTTGAGDIYQIANQLLEH